MAQEKWIEVRFLVPAGMQEEASLFLTEFSGRGVIIQEEDVPAGGALIRAYFRPEEFGAWQQTELQQYLQRLTAYGLYPLGLEMLEVDAEDWAEAWKAHFKPLRVTPHLIIRPPWEDYPAEPGEVVITIYPGMAFGTGRHPSTLLCLRALEDVWERQSPLVPTGGDWQVLDVGTGTGILALAAARMGAKVLAIDLDPEAVAAALENVRLNNLLDRIWVEETPLPFLRDKFPLILANITAPDLQQLAEALAGRLLPGGALIISGFLEEDATGLEARYQSLGLHLAGYLTNDGWGALIFRQG